MRSRGDAGLGGENDGKERDVILPNYKHLAMRQMSILPKKSSVGTRRDGLSHSGPGRVREERRGARALRMCWRCIEASILR